MFKYKSLRFSQLMFSGKKANMAVWGGLGLLFALTIVSVIIGAQVVQSVRNSSSPGVVTLISDQQITATNATLRFLGNTNVIASGVDITNTTNASEKMTGSNFSMGDNSVTFAFTDGAWAGETVNISYNFSDQTRDIAYNSSTDGITAFTNVSGLSAVLGTIIISIILVGLLGGFFLAFKS